VAGLLGRVAKLERAGAETAATRPDLSRYKDDPVGFAADVLGITPTNDQAEIARAFLVAPFMVKVRAGHNVGKTFLFAWLTLWWLYTRTPSVVITTAPTARDVEDLLWTEIRLLHGRAKVPLPDDFTGPEACELKVGPDHFAKGFTAAKGESFQGRHRADMLFLFDEDDGLPAIYFERTRSMFKAGDGHAWGSIGNPYSTSSPSAMEEFEQDLGGNPAWNLFCLNAANHPNVRAELAGRPPPVPNAVSKGQIDAAVAKGCQPVAGPPKPGDFEWPPGSGKWFRPGPVFQAGTLGVRPTQGTNSVWSNAAWEAATAPGRVDPADLVRRGLLPQIGVDVALYGTDWSAIHARVGAASLRHESANGWKPEETAGALKAECRRLAAWVNSVRDRKAQPVTPEEIPVNVEQDGYGEMVLTHGRDWSWRGVSASGTPAEPEQFKNTRSELWFTTADKADGGRIDLTLLPKTVLAKLRQQLLLPTYELNGSGQKVVEEKKATKKRLRGRSPDDADAFNLSHYDPPGVSVATPIDTGDRPRRTRDSRR
jgi:hypothetical protein